MVWQRMNRAISGVWSVICPIGIYFVVINGISIVLTMVVTGITGEYMEHYMMIHTLASGITIPFLYRYYVQDQQEETVFWKRLSKIYQSKGKNERRTDSFLMFLLGAAAGIAVNNAILMTGLMERSEGFRQVNENFFAGSVGFEILGACMVTPFLEELLYRGLVYPRLCDLVITEELERTRQRKAALLKGICMICSGLVFGAMHGNLVQFFYASVLGILLAWLTEQAGGWQGAFFAHAGANFMAVLRADTELFCRMGENARNLAISAVMSAAAASVLILIIGLRGKDKAEGKG